MTSTPDPKSDLERRIRAAYGLIQEYEELMLTASDPKAKVRYRREAAQQWDLIEQWVASYQALCQRLNEPMAEEIRQIAALAASRKAPPPSEAAAPPPPATGATYQVQIGQATGIAIGDGAQVIQSAPAEPSLADDREALERALRRARRALAILEEQVAGFGALHVPAHLQIELEEKREEVARLEARLKAMRKA